jgi:hypothetical protein
MSAASDGIVEKPWAFLQPSGTLQAVFFPQLKACIFTGEHIKLS